MMINAAGIAYYANGKVLLLKRRIEAVHGGTWCFPAGSIEDGESPLAAANREFFEEVGFEPSPLTNNMSQFTEHNGFALFRCVGMNFEPELNEEHTEFLWADPSALPEPLHPGIAEQVAATQDIHAMDSAREVDRNGYVTVMRNPISKAGIFQYMGDQLPGGVSGVVYNVYRPPEELGSADAIASFKGLPIFDEHEMVGDGYTISPEEKGIHGATGDDIIFDGENLLSNLRIFSKTLKTLMDAGKTGLSLGYRCIFEKSAGVINGIRYDYIQRNIRGNHLALVNKGRCGTAVLDHYDVFDHFDLTLPAKTEELPMAEENKSDEKKEDKKEISLDDVHAWAKSNMPQFRELVGMFQEESSETDEGGATLDADEDMSSEAVDEDEEKKDEKKDDDKKDKAMDAAISKLGTRIASVEKRSVKSLMSEIAERDKLAKEVEQHVGTFDYSAMDTADVTAYGIDKLGIVAAKGQERGALAGFLLGTKKASAKNVNFAMDTATVKKDGLLAKRLGKKA